MIGLLQFVVWIIGGIVVLGGMAVMVPTIHRIVTDDEWGTP